MNNRIDLDVPYAEKDRVKNYHVQWDRDKRVWWTTEQYMCEELARYLPYTPTPDCLVQSLLPLYSTAAEQTHVLQLSQNCELKGWLLLMLPHRRWGAFWRDDLPTTRASDIVLGRYEQGCRYVANSPAEALAYMSNHRLHSSLTPLEATVCEDDTRTCYASLTIAGYSLSVELPWICEHFIKHISESPVTLSKYSDLAQEIHAFLDSHTPAHFKLPLEAQLSLAQEMSQTLRVPLPVAAHSNRRVCEVFIEEHAAHFALYKAIRKAVSARAWGAAKLINKYLKWITARAMLVQGIAWEVVARELGVKKQATVEKYVNQADQAERETPQLVNDPLYQTLVRQGLAGESVNDVVRIMIETLVWEEFSHERVVRQKLKEHYACPK